jgi:hypothetical protein
MPPARLRAIGWHLESSSVAALEKGEVSIDCQKGACGRAPPDRHFNLNLVPNVDTRHEVLRMKKGEVRNAIFENLLNILGPIGFKSKKKGYLLERIFEGGCQAIIFSLADYNPTFVFTFLLSVRLDAIQDITNEFNGTPPAEFGSSVSSSTSMEYFIPESKGRFEIMSMDDIAGQFALLKPVFEEKVIPFFLSCITVEDMEKRVNSESDFIYALPKFAAFTGIAAAFLVRPESFEQVVEQHLGGMRRRGFVPHVLEPVERLAEKLRGQLARQDSPGSGA